MARGKKDGIKNHLSLGFKAGLLTTLIGPAAGLCAVLLAFVFRQPISFAASDLSKVPAVTLMLLSWAYIFGIFPALAAGIGWGLYIGSGGKWPWLIGLLIGGVFPPLFLSALDPAATTGNGLMGAAALGLGAAVITECVVYLILRRSFAAAGSSSAGTLKL